MDIRAWEIVIATLLIIVGSYMAFNDKHYLKYGHDKVSKHLAKIQGRIALAAGIAFLIHWLFW
jgi:hypothetical protein